MIFKKAEKQEMVLDLSSAGAKERGVPELFVSSRSPLDLYLSQIYQRKKEILQQVVGGDVSQSLFLFS